MLRSMKDYLVNLNTVLDLESWIQDENNVYIGRQRHPFERSKWANDFKVEEHGRQKAVSLYEKYLRRNQSLLSSVGQLKGKTLGCWCFPKLCHGVILNQLAGNIETETMSKKGKKGNNTNTTTNDDELNQLKERLKTVEGQITTLKDENKLLKARVLVLEDQVAVSNNTSEKLRTEIDRLDQYHRRHNIMLKNVAVPKKPSQDEDEKFVKTLFTKELKLNDAFEDVDKLHRLGPVRNKDGKKTQDIIVRFRSHSMRYKVYSERKKAKTKIRPNLTKRRMDILYRASKLVENVDPVHFVFANEHGDLVLRLNEKVDDKQYFDFKTMEELKETLRELKIDFVDDMDADDED